MVTVVDDVTILTATVARQAAMMIVAIAATAVIVVTVVTVVTVVIVVIVAIAVEIGTTAVVSLAKITHPAVSTATPLAVMNGTVAAGMIASVVEEEEEEEAIPTVRQVRARDLPRPMASRRLEVDNTPTSPTKGNPATEYDD